jgi:hypothetical protein
MALVIVALLGCGGGGMSPPPGMGDDDDDDPPVLVDAGGQTSVCPNGAHTKIRFDEARGCSNDGSVEFCIPDDDVALRAGLAAINPDITCAPGNGLAGCAQTTGKLLCFYPTRFPDQCLSDHGAMTIETWADMCEIANQSAIAEIVPTILE